MKPGSRRPEPPQLWMGSYAPGGVLVGLASWWVDGELTGLAPRVQALDAQGGLEGEVVTLPVIGRAEGNLRIHDALAAPATGVWGVASSRELWLKALVEVGLLAGAPGALPQGAVLRCAPAGHVLVGLRCDVHTERVVNVTGYFDRPQSRRGRAVGDGRLSTTEGPTVATRWKNALVDELLELRASGASMWSHWPAEERRLTPLEVVVPVPERTKRWLWVRTQRSSGALEPLQVLYRGEPLPIGPPEWGDASPLYRVDLSAVPPGPAPLTLRVEQGWAVVTWLELTAVAASE